MLHLKKGEEPKTLTEYKKAENAYFDGYEFKDDIRNNLLGEQGYLCAYCMRRINSVSETKIEHIIPQSALRSDEREALNYKIMVGVCHGNEKRGRKKSQLTCDAHRGNADIAVNPFDENCIRQIKYNTDGIIYSDNVNINQTLNEVLNLNYNGADSYLVSNRKEALKSCRERLIRMQKHGLWSKKNLIKILNEYSSMDAEGKYAPYLGIVLAYINKKLALAN